MILVFVWLILCVCALILNFAEDNGIKKGLETIYRMTSFVRYVWMIRGCKFTAFSRYS